MSEDKNIDQSAGGSPQLTENENISEPELQTINYQPQTNMEVHKHPHHVTHKKKWGEYLLEFFMLFLAVILGFFAENIREHYVEKENAKRYLEAYRDELVQQKNIFEQYKKSYQSKIIITDTVKTIFFNGEENKKINVLERLIVAAVKLIDVPFNTSSYDQMVNSGALRYITNIQLRDSMSDYKGQMEGAKAYNARTLQSIVSTTFEVAKIIDFHDILTADTSQSYNIVQHIPEIKPFGSLSPSERNSVVFFFEWYIVQAQADLKKLRELESSNQNLLNMVNEQLNK